MAATQNEHIINIHSTYMYIHKTQEAQLPQRGHLILKILKTAAQLYEQELIMRWDRTWTFYDDIIHVEASTYTQWTDFLISTITKHLR